MIVDKKSRLFLAAFIAFLGIMFTPDAVLGSGHDSKTEEKAAHADQSADNHHANGAQDHDVSTAANQAEGSEAHSADHGSEKFDAGKVIMDHVTNSHGWHIAGDLELPLPVIIYNKTQKKWQVFSSSKFEHGHAAYLGFTAHQGKLTSTTNEEFMDFSLTKNGFSMFIGAALLLIVLLSVARNYKKRGVKSPKGIASFIEPLILFLRDDVIKPGIGKGYEKFLPYLLTLFFFIFFNNLLGLIPIFPGGANLTGSVAITGILALITFIIVTVNGSKDYWMHIIWPPGIPFGLKFLLIPIEIFGMFLKPVVLMIRLFANITAGHIIILGFFSLIFIFSEINEWIGSGVTVFSVAFSIFMSMLELLVAFLQAYVFTLLSSLYIGGARETHEHEESH